MTRTHRTARALACLAACMLLAAVAAQATAAKAPSVGRGFGFAYDPAHEVTLVGTVQELVTHPAHGNPPGLHVLVSSSGKLVDAHLGPFLSKENQQSLHTGQLVQIIGVHEQVHGRDILLARQLVFAGRQVTVRNERGFLVRGRSGLGPRKIVRNGKVVSTGGAR